jgi:hypothetical protein
MEIYRLLYNNHRFASQCVNLYSEKVIVSDEEWLIHRFLRVASYLKLNVK